MTLQQTLRRQRQRFERRLARNGAELVLTLRNLYILPSGFGGLWVLGTAVLYLLGINSSRNGPLLLAFLCSGLFLLSLFLTQFNLQGLKLAVDHPTPGFANEVLAYPIRLQSGCERHLLRAQFKGQALTLLPRIPAGCSLIQPQWRAEHRGLQTPGLLKLYSKAPLGLFVCWSYWAPPKPQLIYPAPVEGTVIERWIAPQDAAQVQQGSTQNGGTDTFRELSPHRVEEGLQRVAWKHVARGHGWLAKRFEAETLSQRHLSPDPSVERERALQHLCSRVLELSRKGEPFALSIPGAEPVAFGQGVSHRDAALRALALA